jgi:hypothetical protein
MLDMGLIPLLLLLVPQNVCASTRQAMLGLGRVRLSYALQLTNQECPVHITAEQLQCILNTAI